MNSGRYFNFRTFEFKKRKNSVCQVVTILITLIQPFNYSQMHIINYVPATTHCKISDNIN